MCVLLYAGCPGRRRRVREWRGRHTPHAPCPVQQKNVTERKNARTHERARSPNKASTGARSKKQIGSRLTRRSVGTALHARELAHLVLDVRVERDVDGEGDEREEGREEGCEGGEEGEGDVGGEGEEEGD